MQGPGEGARTGSSRSTSGTFCALILTPAVTHPLSTLGGSSLSLHQCGATAARNAASCPTPGAGRSIPWRGPESPTCGFPFPRHFTCCSLSCFFHPTAGLRSPRGRGRWLPPPRVPSSLRLGGPEVPRVGASACPASLSLQIPPERTLCSFWSREGPKLGQQGCDSNLSALALSEGTDVAPERTCALRSCRVGVTAPFYRQEKGDSKGSQQMSPGRLVPACPACDLGSHQRAPPLGVPGGPLPAEWVKGGRAPSPSVCCCGQGRGSAWPPSARGRLLCSPLSPADPTPAGLGCSSWRLVVGPRKKGVPCVGRRIGGGLRACERDEPAAPAEPPCRDAAQPAWACSGDSTPPGWAGASRGLSQPRPASRAPPTLR